VVFVLERPLGVGSEEKKEELCFVCEGKRRADQISKPSGLEGS
jgi:hypothetical protein